MAKQTNTQKPNCPQCAEYIRRILELKEQFEQPPDEKEVREEDLIPVSESALAALSWQAMTCHDAVEMVMDFCANQGNIPLVESVLRLVRPVLWRVHTKLEDPKLCLVKSVKDIEIAWGEDEGEE